MHVFRVEGLLNRFGQILQRSGVELRPSFEVDDKIWIVRNRRRSTSRYCWPKIIEHYLKVARNPSRPQACRVLIPDVHKRLES